VTNRTSGQLLTTTGSLTVRDSNGNPAWGESWSAHTTSSTWTTSGVDTPQFNRKKAQGVILPFNTYSSVKQEIVASEGNVDLQGGPTWFTGYTWKTNTTCALSSANHGEWQPTLADLERWRTTISRDALLQAAVSKLSAEFDALTFLAELGELKTLVRKSLWDLITILRQELSRAEKFRKVANKGPGWWLEYRYGIRPLISDIKAINAIVRGERPSYRTIRKNARSAAAFDEHIPSGAANSILTWTGDLHHRVSVSVKAMAIADMVKPDFKFNLFSTAWELVPYSFLIDWLVNIGAAIDALTMKVTVNPSCGVGTYLDVVSTKTIFGAGVYPQCLGTYTSKTVWHHEEKTRLPASIPVMPSFNLRLDAFKIADLAAMAYQLLTKIRF
jgi:hypothetical protein